MSETPMTPDAALARLQQYREKKTFRSATYESGTERALHEIGTVLADEVGRLRGELDATRAMRDCLASATRFALAWSPKAPFELREGIQEILATMPAGGDTPREDGPSGSGERCPQCGSDDYGPLDIAWPHGLPEHNPNPSISYVVGVCCTCGYTTDTDATEGGESS